MTGKPPVRVAIIGLGWAARHIWLDRFAAHPGYEVAVMVDPDPRARPSVSTDRVRVLDDIAVLDPATVDLAIVAVPNHLHAATAGLLLARGITTFVEKPVCLTSGEASRLAAAERASAAMLLAGSAARYRADVRQLYAALGDVGAVRHVEASWVRARGVPGAGGWFTDRRRAGGGALLDLGWHLLDVVGPILGAATFPYAVGTMSADFVARGTAAAAWRRDVVAAAGDVEDTARGFLVTDDGVSVALRVSWASHEPLDVTRIKVEGSAGTLLLTCTFGFSPNRVDRSLLQLIHDGQTIDVALPDEAVGAEYDRQLDELLLSLADPASRGKAVAQADRAIRLIERLYTSAHRYPVGGHRPLVTSRR